MKKVLLALLFAGVSSLVAADGQAVYAKCISCHGADGKTKALGRSQVIAGWPADQHIAALKGYKDGSYGGPMKNLMKGQVANLSDAEIEAVAKYVEGL